MYSNYSLSSLNLIRTYVEFLNWADNDDATTITINKRGP